MPAAHLAGARVERQVAEAQDPRSQRVGALRRIRARIRARQLLQGERLDQVVVGPGVQAVHPLGDCRPGREHQHRRPVTGGPQAPAHFEAVEAGHRDVEHYGVSRSLGVRRQAGHAVFGQLRRVALETKSARSSAWRTAGSSSTTRTLIHHSYGSLVLPCPDLRTC